MCALCAALCPRCSAIPPSLPHSLVPAHQHSLRACAHAHTNSRALSLARTHTHWRAPPPCGQSSRAHAHTNECAGTFTARFRARYTELGARPHLGDADGMWREERRKKNKEGREREEREVSGKAWVGDRGLCDSEGEIRRSDEKKHFG